MAKSNALIPTSQKTIVFYEDEITAVILEGDEQEIYVPLRPLCDYLGLDWSGQRQRINRDLVLADVVSGVVITPPPLGDNKFANPQEMLCLPLDYLNGWLFGINARRVKDEVRDKLVRYQKECYRVLARELTTAVSPTQSSSLQQVRDMGLAIARLAEEQMIFEQRLDTTDAQLKETTIVVSDLRADVELLKARTDPGEEISDEQASQISQAVKAVALAQGKQTGRNEFGATYGELYRKFGTTSYKKIKKSQFDEVMTWLTTWHQNLVGDNPF